MKPGAVFLTFLPPTGFSSFVMAPTFAAIATWASWSLPVDLPFVCCFITFTMCLTVRRVCSIDITRKRPVAFGRRVNLLVLSSPYLRGVYGPGAWCCPRI